MLKAHFFCENGVSQDNFWILSMILNIIDEQSDWHMAHVYGPDDFVIGRILINTEFVSICQI